jgi:tRNA threonylcarbamoyladenosine biosynthesis protein TsaE
MIGAIFFLKKSLNYTKKLSFSQAIKPFLSTSEARTVQYAFKLAAKAKTPLCICLYGDLGYGKTVFCKGFAKGLGLPERKIKSPTYTLIRKYDLGKKFFYHCDFYRIREPDDLLTADLEEMFAQKNAIILIEWPERIEKLLPKKRLNVIIDYKDDHTRLITLNSNA